VPYALGRKKKKERRERKSGARASKKKEPELVTLLKIGKEEKGGRNLPLAE